VKALSLICVVLGAWLIAAGLAWSADVAIVMGERIVAGILIVALALGVFATASASLAWLVALAGLWTAVAPTLLHYGSVGVGSPNDLIVGVLVLLLGFFAAISKGSAAVGTHA
jgi:hypothetical protein